MIGESQCACCLFTSAPRKPGGGGATCTRERAAERGRAARRRGGGGGGLRLAPRHRNAVTHQNIQISREKITSRRSQKSEHGYPSSVPHSFSQRQSLFNNGNHSAISH